MPSMTKATLVSLRTSLGSMEVYDPSSDSATGVMVPMVSFDTREGSTDTVGSSKSATSKIQQVYSQHYRGGGNSF